MDYSSLLNILGLLGDSGKQIQQMIEQLMLMVAVISLILALLQCYSGYRLLRFWIRVIGFLIGFLASMGVIAANFQDLQMVVRILISIGIGVLLAFLFNKLYRVGIFLFCGFLAGGSVAVSGILGKNQETAVGYIILAAVFILAGILAVKFQRAVIIVLTSVSGAVHAVTALRQIVPEVQANATTANLILAFLVVTGVLVQFMTTKKYKKK